MRGRWQNSSDSIVRTPQTAIRHGGRARRPGRDAAAGLRAGGLSSPGYMLIPRARGYAAPGPPVALPGLVPDPPDVRVAAPAVLAPSAGCGCWLRGYARLARTYSERVRFARAGLSCPCRIVQRRMWRARSVRNFGRCSMQLVVSARSGKGWAIAPSARAHSGFDIQVVANIHHG